MLKISSKYIQYTFKGVKFYYFRVNNKIKPRISAIFQYPVVGIELEQIEFCSLTEIMFAAVPLGVAVAQCCISMPQIMQMFVNANTRHPVTAARILYFFTSPRIPSVLEICRKWLIPKLIQVQSLI
jgi:hypothetical protein